MVGNALSLGALLETGSYIFLIRTIIRHAINIEYDFHIIKKVSAVIWPEMFVSYFSNVENLKTC